MTKRHQAKYKIDRRMGQNIWGRPKSPDQQPRIRPRPARPAPQGQALRLRRAAARQAEAQGLLRQHVRAAVPRHLRRSAAAEGRYRRAHDRPSGAPARRRHLPRQIRADRVCRAPVRQSRPHQGERQARQHPELSASRSAISSRSRKSRSSWRWCSRRTGLAERDVPDYIEVDHAKMTAKLARMPLIADVPYPVHDGAASGGGILLALRALDGDFTARLELCPERPAVGGLCRLLAKLRRFHRRANCARVLKSYAPSMIAIVHACLC